MRHDLEFHLPIRLGDFGLTLLELRRIIVLLASFGSVFLVRGGVTVSLPVM